MAFSDLFSRLFRAAALFSIVAASNAPVTGQQAGWSYSPLLGEGDRAAMGCGLASSATSYVCLVVRCEDDFTIGVHIATSRASNDAGDWAITIDKETRDFSAVSALPYGAKLTGDIAWVLDGLKNGAVAYLQPQDGMALPDNHLALNGSLYTINRALAWCTPRVPTIEPNASTGV